MYHPDTSPTIDTAFETCNQPALRPHDFRELAALGAPKAASSGKLLGGGGPGGFDLRGHPGTLAGVGTRRAIVDYALQRRTLLADLYAGRVSATEVCDATPYLVRAATYHGERTQTPCPVCRREPVWHVNYVYGDELKAAAGQAKRAEELSRMERQYSAFRVYVVEVCRGCGWNHLARSFVQGGTGGEPGDSGDGVVQAR